MTQPTKAYCHYSLDQVADSNLLSPDRMAAVRAEIESRISTVHDSAGNLVTTSRIGRFKDGSRFVYPQVDSDLQWSYLHRELMADILTPEELALVNKRCLDGWRATADRKHFEKATKLDRWDGWVTDGERYASSVEEWLEDHGDEYEDGVEEAAPVYLWVAVPQQVIPHLDVDDITEHWVCDRGWEDMDLDDLNGVAELRVALDAFVKANETVVSYAPDHSRVVILNGYLAKPVRP